MFTKDNEESTQNCNDLPIQKPYNKIYLMIIYYQFQLK